MQALPASAGPLSDLLPNSSPKVCSDPACTPSFVQTEFRVLWGSGQTPFKLLQTENNMKLFERDLGEGRKLVPEPDQVKDDKSRLPAPLPFKKAERATPDMKV